MYLCVRVRNSEFVYACVRERNSELKSVCVLKGLRKDTIWCVFVCVYKKRCF